MIEKHSQSVFDYLVVLLPEISKDVTNEYVDPHSAKKLFSMWRDEKNVVDERTLRRPTDVSAQDVAALEKAGLVTRMGDNVEITTKGADVIKVMILGDDKSVFEPDDVIINYADALASSNAPQTRIAGRKTVLSSDINEKASNNWWDRFTKNI